MRSFVKKLIGLVVLLTGLAQAQHVADLSWVAVSPSVGVSGYKVYKAPCNGTITGTGCSSIGAFVLLNSTAGITFQDTGLASTQKLVYQVTSYCSGTCGNGATGESSPTAPYAVYIPDTIPPVVSLTSPSSGPISGLVTLTATCTDDVAVARVFFRASRQGTGVIPIGNPITVAPYTVVWDTKAVPAGSYIITVVCTDTANNNSSSATNITNTSGPTAPPTGLSGVVH